MMQKPKNIPSCPGVYKMIDAERKIIYVGKAKNLRKRVGSYFNKNINSLRIEKMVEKIRDVKWIETESEIEALMLETNLIKELQPRYNIAMRDDKNFVYVKITINEDFPRITIVRKVIRDSAKYFGPITSAHKVKHTFKVLRKVLPFRTCNLDIKYENGKCNVTKKSIKTPCLDHYIKRCVAPCIDLCKPNDYKQIIDQVISFLEGKPEEIITMVKKEMNLAAAGRNFEKAASLRDKLTMIMNLSQKQVITDPKMANLDVINFHREGTYIYFNLFRIRNGKLINQENFTLKSVEVEDDPVEILENFIKQYYEKAASIPSEVVIPFGIESLLGKWINTKFVVPRRGDKRNLLDLALKNAESYAKQSRVRIMQDGVDPVYELQNILGLKKRPVRMECYDISHLAGTNQVGSMVVFEDGLAKKSDYRRFKIKIAKDSDDYGSHGEMLTRRLSYLGEIKDNYSIKRALKKEQKAIEKIVNVQPMLDQRNIDYAQFIVIKNKDKIVGFIREKVLGQTHKLSSLWISEKERGAKLGHRLLKHAVNKSKGKRIYLNCTPELASYYEAIGFQKIKKVPKDLMKEDLYWKKVDCNCGIWFAYDKKKRKDSSFGAKPDLIIIDGGKGQLKVGQKVLKKFGLEIPLISIAKKNEEIYYGTKKIVLERNSEALKLVQRARDEAHRFAIEHQRKLRKF